MGKINEENLLQTIKGIYDQYSSVDCLLFTTFNFDPEFFANHLVSELMGRGHEKGSAISTISDLNAANEWLEENHVSVFYDISAFRDNGNTALTIPIYPVHIETGVFHPKVIAIFGKTESGRRISHLIVSSANLTVSGYARNVECFSAIEVTSGIVADSLAGFIRQLKRRSDKLASDKTISATLNSFIEYLSYTRFRRDDSVEFFWNIGDADRKENWLLTRLAEEPDGDMQIISPYFDKNGPGELIDDITDGNVTIYPAKDGARYNICKKDYRALKKSGVDFAEYVNNDGSHIRFVHAKIIRKGGCIVEGSYNFTEAALCGKNAEAALIYYVSRGKLDISAKDVDPGMFLNEDDVVDCQDTAEGLGRFYIILTVDWKEMLIHIDCDNLDDHKYSIKLGNVLLDWDGKSNTVQIDSRQLEDSLLRDKSFTLYKDGEQVYLGRFNELNWSENRPEIACRNLGEAVAEWFNADKRDENVHTQEYEVRPLLSEETILDEIRYSERDEKDVFDNYYYLASAMNSLLNRLREASDNKTRYRIFSTSPGSMRRIIEFVQEQLNGTDNDPAYFWLLLKFLDKAYDLLPESAVQITNYATERETFRDTLDNCIERCRELIFNASAKKNGSIEKFLDWIDKEFNAR